MNSICVKPWTELHVWGTCATVCCWANPYISYPEFSPSQYLWNCKSLNELRNRMLMGGVKDACPNCTLYVGDLDRELKSHHDQYPSPIWDTIGRQNVLKNESTYPLVSAIMVGDLCNSRCKMCWLRGRQKPNTSRYTLDTINVIRKTCKESRYMTLSGGDIFAYDDEYIDFMLSISPNAVYEAITNGQGLSQDRIDKYVNSGKIPRLKISLETVRASDYMKHCGRPQGDLLTRLKLIDPRNVVWYSSVITMWTLDGLPDLIEYAHQTGVNFVVIKPVVGDMLSKTGYGFADIFTVGYTPELHQHALEVFNKTEDLARQYSVSICDLNIVRKQLDIAHDRLSKTP